MNDPASRPIDEGLCIACGEDVLVGVMTRPPFRGSGIGVLIVVGGPQYRVGSHRQFRLLATRLAQAGHVVLRFDSRGMGDSSGRFVGFDALGPELQAATRALRMQPGVERVVWWGLCDAASAALLNANGPERPAGLVLLNPWVRHASTLVKVEVKQYYLQRLRQRAFWAKLLAGRINPFSAIGGLLRRVTQVLCGASAPAGGPADFREGMAIAAMRFEGPQLYLLSERDHVSAEFIEYVKSSPALSGLWSRGRVRRVDVAGADHTFSNARWRGEVEDLTLEWLNGAEAS